MRNIQMVILTMIIMTQLSVTSLNATKVTADPVVNHVEQSDTTVVVDKEVIVGLYILNIGKFDISSGAYTADFYLSFRCKNNFPEFDFEFMNGRAASIDKITNTATERLYRIQANLASSIDLRKYPFDKQKLQVILEDKRNTMDKVVFIPDLEKTEIDSSVTITGWEMNKWKAETITHSYKIYGENYSQYIFSIPISRILLNSILKTLLPIIFIILVMLSSFILDPDKITTRIAMVSSSLVASVMFHVSLANQIPPVSYLTFIDKFMGLTYLLILLCFVINVFLLELLERKKTALVEKIHHRTEFSMYVIIPVIYALFFMFVK